MQAYGDPGQVTTSLALSPPSRALVLPPLAPFANDAKLTCSVGDMQLAESTQQLLLRMADYTRQTVELTRQELHVVVMNQVSC